MASSNQYRSSIVSLAGGLDFVTPKLMVDQGKLIDCYNFEVADRLGYKRIDGIEPFDGRAGPALVYSNLILIEYELLGMSTNPVTGEYIKLADEKGIGIGPCARDFQFGFPEVNVMAVIVTDYEQLYKLAPGLVLTTLDGASQYTIISVGGTELLQGAAYDTDAEKFDTYVSTYSNYEDTVTSLPAGRKLGDPVTFTPATSMKWYKDRLYITQDTSQLAFGDSDVELYPNDVFDDGLGNTYRVLSVRLSEGAYPQGDAAGIVLAVKLSGNWPPSVTAVDVKRNGISIGNTDIDSARIAAAYEESWAGSLWRSKDITQADFDHTNQGWEFVETGFVFDYKAGNDYGTPAAPPPLPGREITPLEVPVNTASPSLAFTSGATPFLGAIWTLQGGATDIADAVALGDGVEFIRTANGANYGNSPNTTVTMSTVNLDEIPDDAVLLGLEVTVRARAAAIGVPSGPQTIAVKMSTANSVSKNTAALTGSFADYSVGGANDLWGSTGLDMATLRSLALQVKVTPNYKGVVLGVDGYTTDIDQISLKVYYQVTVSQLFFWNGTNDVTATIVNYSIDDGTWAAGDAKGQMHVKTITPIAPGNRTAILASDQIRTAAGGLGDLVALVDSNMDFAGVPSFEQMLEAESRATIIVTNFYGIDDWEAMYAVTGAGRAWTYDDYYFRYIYTGLPISKDLPRHVAFFKHHLCLGYSSGNVTLSVVGEPLNFSGVDGAASFDVGDRVTGLGRMNGDVLGVFCESSVIGLSGSDVTDLNAQILNSSEGAIEYTLVDAGGKLIYCSYSGISTFDQTAAYGDFLGSRLSASISPWLIPRLSGKAPALEYTRSTDRGSSFKAAIGKGPVFAYPVRRKNQYRLVFEDGYTLMMTLFGNEQLPVFTISLLYDGDERYDSDVPLIPFCHHVSVDRFGAERIHMSAYSALDDQSLMRFCYELDQGWLYRSGTATNTIHGNFTVTNNFMDTPFEFKTVRKIRAHGQTKGRGQYKVAISSDYRDDFPDSLSDPRWQPISLPRDVDMGQFGASDYYPTTDIVDAACRGNSNSFQFREVPVNQPPVIFQTLLLQLVDGKGDV